MDLVFSTATIPWTLLSASSAQMAQQLATTTPASIVPGDHAGYMNLALSLAKESPPKPTNFCVGAVLLDEPNNKILSTGYTLELPGNTHAEQCCFLKVAQQHNLPEDRVGEVLPGGTALYTTMEPCNKRSVGNLPCVDRILRTKTSGNGGIRTVYSGVKEPETFVGENVGRTKLEENGVRCVYVGGFEEDILKVATAGHGRAG